jgi:uncharacterized protein (DUF302 family)
MTTTPTTGRYPVVRLTYDSALGFEETRARFDQRVPPFDPAVSIELVLAGAPWTDVQAAVDRTVGPTGFVALSRLDTGALLSLSGQPLDATQYLVGNPVVAQSITAVEPVAALYVPFRAAVYRDAGGVHIAYDQPSSALASLGSAEIDVIAAQLDDKIRLVAEQSSG